MAHNDLSRARDMEKRNRRRAEWIVTHGPCVECESSEHLEVDHIDPLQKVSHCVWSWSEVKRNIELAKCQVLCYKCHKAKTARQFSERYTGRILSNRRKIADRQIIKAVMLRQSGQTVRQVAKLMGVSHVTIVRLTNAAINRKDFHHRGVLLGT